ncbi:MAG TPA: dihydrofolate reductase [Geobacteraceae bacterium]
MTAVIISIIAAMAENRVIGRKGAIPWDLPADRHRFRDLTMGHTLIMGRRTFESIGRALPGRRTLVVSGTAGYTAPGCLVFPTLAAALAACTGEDEVFICGGEVLYREALPITTRIYLTVIQGEIAGDTFFPPIPPEFAETAREPLAGDLPATLIVFTRRS